MNALDVTFIVKVMFVLLHPNSDHNVTITFEDGLMWQTLIRFLFV